MARFSLMSEPSRPRNALSLSHASPFTSSHVFALALAVLSPLAVLPSAYNPYNFPKLLVMALAVATGAFAERRGVLPRIVLYVVGAGAVVFVLAAVTGPGSSLPGLIGRWPRYEGLPTLGIYLGAAWLGARLLARPDVDLIRSFRWWVSVSALVLFMFSVFDSLGISVIGLTFANRTGALLGNATDQGLVAMMLGSVLLGPALRGRAPLHLAALGASMLTVGFSGSRAAIITSVLVLGLHALRGDRVQAKAFAGVAVGLGAIVALLPEAWNRLFTGRTVESRTLAWKETIRLARDHPWRGTGPSGYTDAIGQYQDPHWVRVAGAISKPDSPHSWPLQALAAGGFPLLITAVLLAYLIVRFGWRAVKQSASVLDAKVSRAARLEGEVLAEHYLGLFAAVAGYGVGILINFTTPGPTSLAAFLTGALIGVSVTAGPDFERGFALVVGSLVSIGMFMACMSDVALRNGAELAAGGRVQQAIDRFGTAHNLRPYDPDVHMLASQFLAEQASRGSVVAAAAAASEARAALRANPHSYESNTALGVALICEHSYVSALRVLNNAVVEYPFRGQAYIQRGIARIRVGDINGGVLDLQKATVLRPDDPIPVRLLLQIQSQIELAKAQAKAPKSAKQSAAQKRSAR